MPCLDTAWQNWQVLAKRQEIKPDCGVNAPLTNEQSVSQCRRYFYSYTGHRVEDIHRNDNTNNDGAAVDYDDFPGNCSNIVCRFLPLIQPIVTMMVMLGEKMAH